MGGVHPRSRRVKTEFVQLAIQIAGDEQHSDCRDTVSDSLDSDQCYQVRQIVRRRRLCTNSPIHITAILSTPIISPKAQLKVIWDSNPDPDVHRFAPKMWLVDPLSASGISSSFEKSCQWLDVREMLINRLKCLIVQCWGKCKSDPESVFKTGSPPRVNSSFRLVKRIIKLQWNWLITFDDGPTNKHT